VDRDDSGEPGADYAEGEAQQGDSQVACEAARHRANGPWAKELSPLLIWTLRNTLAARSEGLAVTLMQTVLGAAGTENGDTAVIGIVTFCVVASRKIIKPKMLAEPVAMVCPGGQTAPQHRGAWSRCAVRRAFVRGGGKG